MMKYQTFQPTSDTALSSSEDEADYILSSLFKMTARKGYSMWLAAVFICAFMAGMGVLAVPHSLAGTSWYGLALIGVACVNSWYSAMVLGRSWMILEERWDEYRSKCRYPYPAMGQRAVGNWMRYLVSLSLNISLIGIAVVYILLAAQIAQSMTEHVLSLNYGYWIIILSVALCPLTWLGSIEEFWFAAVGALGTAGLACFSLLAAIIIEQPHVKEVTYNKPDLTSSALAFGTILFSFGGTYICPTVQNDMRNREHINKSTALAFVGLLLLYLPVSIAGYAVFGSSVQPNILLSLSDSYLKTFIQACLAAHILLAFLIAVNPVSQEVEEFIGIAPDFNYKRCLIRSFIVGIVLLIAYSIPHFDKILNLIGGSTMTLLTFIYPPLFYMLLNRIENKDGSIESKVPLLEKIYLIQIMVLGIAGGLSCTYFAAKDIVNVFTEDPKADQMITGHI